MSSRPGAHGSYSAMESALLSSPTLSGTTLAAEVRAMRAGPVRFRDLGALSAPGEAILPGYTLVPPVDASPVIDAATAVAVSRFHHQGPPTVLLAILSGPSNRDGTLDGRLVWVVQWQGARWATSGPAPGPGGQARTLEVVGTASVLVDAETAAVLYRQQTGTSGGAGR